MPSYDLRINGSVRRVDSSDADKLHVLAWGAYLESTTFRNEASGFDKIAASLTQSGNDAKPVESTDYVFELLGKPK